MFGPSVRLQGFDIEVERSTHSLPIHPFDPNKCYLFYRAWFCGSCPHVYFLYNNHIWKYQGELFRDSDGSNDVEELINIPAEVTLVRIIETDFEKSEISYAEMNGESLNLENVSLQQGDFFDFQVATLGTLRLKGHYEASILRAQNYFQFRQQLSFRKMFEREILI